jgi:hypothetical protein
VGKRSRSGGRFGFLLVDESSGAEKLPYVPSLAAYLPLADQLQAMFLSSSMDPSAGVFLQHAPLLSLGVG